MTLTSFQQLPPLAQLYTALRLGLRLITQELPGGTVKLYYLEGEPSFFAELGVDAVSQRTTLLRSFALEELPPEYVAYQTLPG